MFAGKERNRCETASGPPRSRADGDGDDVENPMYSTARTFVLLLTFVVATAATASAGVYVVNTAQDNGVGSLRQAILDANGHPGADSIVFMIGGSKTIKLQSELPAITEALEINGHSQLGPGGTL